MPKIKKASFRFDISEKRVYFDADMMYSSKTGFYIKLPSEYREAALAMSDNELRDINVEVVRKNFRTEVEKLIITGTTEADCEENVKKAIKVFASQSVQKRNVIAIRMDNRTPQHYGSDFNLDSVRVELAVTYCTEIKLGSNITYCKFKPSTWDEKELRRVDIHMPRDITVIDDTPQNREFLEKLHAALENLRSQLDEYLKTPEDAMRLITGNIKLLG